METEGNEGEAIISLALAQLDVKGLDNGGVTLANITAELLVEIAVKSLTLITGEELNISTKLPQNVASRHRICTNLAKKIKVVHEWVNRGEYQGRGTLHFHICVWTEFTEEHMGSV